MPVVPPPPRFLLHCVCLLCHRRTWWIQHGSVSAFTLTTSSSSSSSSNPPFPLYTHLGAVECFRFSLYCICGNDALFGARSRVMRCVRAVCTYAQPPFDGGLCAAACCGTGTSGAAKCVPKRHIPISFLGLALAGCNNSAKHVKTVSPATQPPTKPRKRKSNEEIEWQRMCSTLKPLLQCDKMGPIRFGIFFLSFAVP